MPEQRLLLGQVRFIIGDPHLLRIALSDEGTDFIAKFFICFRQAQLHRPLLLPLLAEWTDLGLEGPGIARLLVELPIGLGHCGRTHQAIGIEILDRLLSFTLRNELAHPFGIDTRSR